jgi:hypothetical protein
MNLLYILMFIFGFIIKSYDEIIDNKLLKLDFFLKLFEILIVGLITILTINDNEFIIWSLIYIFTTYIGDLLLKLYQQKNEKTIAIDNYFWKVLIIYIFIISIIKWSYNNSIKTINTFSYITIFLYILITILEAFICSEEYSIKKLVIRYILLILFIIIILLSIFYNLSSSNIFYYLYIWIIGYFISWFIFKLYIIPFYKKQIKQKTNKTKTTKNKKIKDKKTNKKLQQTKLEN